MDVQMEDCLSCVNAFRELRVVVEVCDLGEWLLKMRHAFLHEVSRVLHGADNCAAGGRGILFAVHDVFLWDNEDVARGAGAEGDDADGVVPFLD
jgi:hypothetical protein